MFFSVAAGVVGKRYEVLGLLDLITFRWKYDELYFDRIVFVGF